MILQFEHHGCNFNRMRSEALDWPNLKYEVRMQANRIKVKFLSVLK